MLESVIVSLNGELNLSWDIISRILDDTQFKGQVSIDYVNNQKFSDGELCVDFKNSIRGKRVYILSSPNTSDEIMRLNLAIDAAKRAAAKEIIPILPYFPYARQDKKDQKRGPIGAKVIVEMLEHRGATGVITFDLHADQIQGFFNIPVTHLEGKNVFDSYIASIYNEETILCGPDAGSGKRVKRMKDQLQKYHDISINYVMLDKTRKEANVVDEMIIIGDVSGKDVIILDDMVDTAGTLCKAAEVLIDAGANSVRAIISHGVLSGPAYERIENSKLTELVISNSLDSVKSKKIKIVSLDRQIMLAISAINNQTSYEGLKKERF
jgi:ribose-phosphate pyrophosphokinase